MDWRGSDLLHFSLLTVAILCGQAVADEPSAAKTPVVKTDLYGDPLPEHAIARCGTMRLRMLSPVHALAFIDEKTFVSVGDHHKICFWDVETGKRIRESEQRIAAVAALSPNGRYLLATDYLIKAGVPRQYPLHLWDLQKLEIVASFKPLSFFVVSAAVANDGKRFVVMTNDLKLHVFDTDTTSECEIVGTTLLPGTGKSVRRIFRPPQQRIAMSADGKVIAYPTDRGLFLVSVQSRTVDSTGMAARLDVTHEEVLDGSLAPNGHAIAFSDDGDTVAFSRTNGIQLLDCKTRKAQSFFALERCIGVDAIRFSADGSVFAVSYQDSRENVLLKVCPVEAESKPAFAELQGGRIQSLVFSPDAALLISGDSNGKLRIWNARNLTEMIPLAGHIARVTSVVFGPTEDTLISGSEDSSIRFWSERTGQQKMSITDSYGEVTALCLSADGATVYAAARRKGIEAIDVRSYMTTHCYDYTDDSLSSLQLLTPTGLVAASTQGGLRLIDTTTCKLIDDVVNNWPQRLESMSIHREDSTVVGVGANALVYDFSTSKKLVEITYRRKNGVPRRAVSIRSTEGRVIIVADHTHALNWFWDDSAPFATRLNHQSDIRAMVTSKNGDLLATGDTSGFIHLWESSTAKHLGSFRHSELRSVSSLVFSDDGNRLASCGSDGLIYLWNVGIFGAKPNQIRGEHGSNSLE